MKKAKVLFVCIHNSARSQMAEALLQKECGHVFDVQSARLEPGVLNPLAVEVMREVGLDISGKKTRSVLDVTRGGELFAYVITVCDEASAERCPIFPGITKRLHWGFSDPSAFGGDHEEKLRKTRQVRDAILAKIREWCPAVCDELALHG